MVRIHASPPWEERVIELGAGPGEYVLIDEFHIATECVPEPSMLAMRSTITVFPVCSQSCFQSHAGVSPTAAGRRWALTMRCHQIRLTHGLTILYYARGWRSR